VNKAIFDIKKDMEAAGMQIGICYYQFITNESTKYNQACKQVQKHIPGLEIVRLYRCRINGAAVHPGHLVLEEVPVVHHQAAGHCFQ
jgi:hypothetical protein